MREMTTTLAEAATHWGGRAEVSLTIVDRRARWSAIRQGSGGGDWAALAADGAAILRARVDASGAIYAARVTDPADPDQWAAWQQVGPAGAALAGGDVALAQVGGAGRIRLFYAAPDGASAYAAQCLTSSDGGANWSAPSVVIAGLADAPQLAAAEDHCFVFSAERVRAYAKPWGMGAWAQDGYWTALQLGDRQGLACAYDAEAGVYRLIVCGDGCVMLGAFDPAAATWWGPQRIAPGGEQAAPSAANPRGPGAAIGPEGCYYAWVDDHQGSPEAWVQPVVRRAWGGAPPNGGVHTGDEAALSLPAAAQRRVALCYVAAEGAVYAANDVSACRGAVSGAAASPVVTRYDRHADEDGSRLRIEVAPVLADGAPLPAPTALQTVILHRGYRTAAGAETVALDPHYVVAATTLAGQGGGRMEIEAVDGWGLLGLWRPEEPLSWQNRAIRWIIAALCARVGLRYADDASDALGEAINLFTLLPTQTAAEGVRALLDLAGAAARFDQDGALVALAWEDEDPPQALAIGANGEIRQGRYEARVPGATGWRAAGQGVAAAGDDCAASMALGLRLMGSTEDNRAVNTPMAERLRAWRLACALMAARRDQATVPLRPDAELWDGVALTDPALGEGAHPRVAVALRERYDPAAGRYETTVGMGER